MKLFVDIGDDNIFNKQPDETFMDWKIRLITNKIDKVYDIDWSEIVDLLQANCSADHMRKTAYGIYELHNYYKENNIIFNTTSDDYLNMIEQKKVELQLERKKIQSISVEYNKILREEARRQLVLDEIKSEIKSIKPPSFNPIIYDVNNKSSALLAFSDIHYGKIFTSLHNKYSEEIAKDRMENLLSETVNICKKENITKLTVINLGDSIEGLIRISQLKMLQDNLINTVIKFTRLMAEWLNELSKYVEIDYHHVISSNHSQIRPFNSKRSEFSEEDLEIIIVNYIYDILKDNKRINVFIPENNFIEFELVGFNFIAEHGHDVKNLSNYLKDMSNFRRKFYDFVLVSHKHHSEEITVGEGIGHNCEILMIPSVMGSDDYADKLRVGSKAGAKLFLFEESLGKKISYNIILN